MKRQLHIPDAEARAIFNRIDQTGDQEIHYTQFVAAAMQAKLLLHEKYIREAFQKFDVDNTGLISEDDLHRVLGDEGEDVGQMLREMECKTKGQIDYEEFVKILMDTSETVTHEPTAGYLAASKSFTNKLLQITDENVVSLAVGQSGPATFTWGSCRRDARFKFDMKTLEELMQVPVAVRETMSEQGAGSSDADPNDAVEYPI